MSQLYPVNYVPTTQTIYIDSIESINGSKGNLKSPTIAFRPIIPKVLTKNVLSATNDNLQNMVHSNTNFFLSASDQLDYSASYNHLSSTYRTLS